MRLAAAVQLAVYVLLLARCAPDQMSEPGNAPAPTEAADVATEVSSGNATAPLWDSLAALGDCRGRDDSSCHGWIGRLANHTRVDVLDHSSDCGKMAHVKVASGALAGKTGCVPRAYLVASGYYLPNGK